MGPSMNSDGEPLTGPGKQPQFAAAAAHFAVVGKLEHVGSQFPKPRVPHADVSPRVKIMSPTPINRPQSVACWHDVADVMRHSAGPTAPPEALPRPG